MEPSPTPRRARIFALVATAASLCVLLWAGPASARTDPAVVILSPKTATNPVNGVHCVTVTALDAFAQPVDGAFVVILVNDAVTGELLFRSLGRTIDGVYKFCYQGPNNPRVDRITAFADLNENETLDPGEPVDEGSKVWVLETAAPGQATGGGHVLGLSTEIGFAFNAQLTGAGLQGNCQVFDRGPDIRIDCLDVDSLVIVGTHASIAGRATVNGVETRYEIETDDLGEPGSGRDTFTIRTDSGYVATGVLLNGNVLVRPTL
jgi:hypothetical protein